MGIRVWPHHALNAVVAFLALTWWLGEPALATALVLTLGYPLAWIFLVRRERRLEALPSSRPRLYAHASVCLSVVAWLGCVGLTVFYLFLLLAFRPREVTVEVFDGVDTGLGRVENRTRLEPEFGDGLVRRNTYTFVAPETGKREEIGSQEGEAGMFAYAENEGFQASEEGLEFVVGAFVGKRFTGGAEPRWLAWQVGHSGELVFLREHFPPLAVIEKAYGDQEVWRYPLPWLRSASILALDSPGNRLRASARLGQREVLLTYRRAAYVDPWELDAEAVLAENPQPEAPAFPADVSVELRVVSVDPAVDLLDPGPEYADPDALPVRAGLTDFYASRAPLTSEAQAELTYSLPTGDEPFEARHFLQAAWSQADGSLVYFLGDRRHDFSLLRGQPRDRWVRVQHYQAAGVSYLVFLRLRTN